MPKLSDLKEIYGIEEKPKKVSLGFGHSKISKEPIYLTKPKPTKKILGDKDLNKNEIVDYITDYVKKNKDTFTLDWLRGQKLTFESVFEMRKERV